MRKKLLAAGFVMFGTVLSACGGGGYYVAAYAPPAPRYGIVGVAPGPGFVWTEGYWNLAGSRWLWMPGRWMRPPHRNAVWVAPEWRQEGRGYRFHRGYWR